MELITHNRSSSLSDCNSSYSNCSKDLDHFDPFYYNHPLGKAVDWLIIGVGLPAIGLAGYALFRLDRADYVAPVFVINLLISDLLQIAITAVFIASRYFDAEMAALRTARAVSRVIVHLGLAASLAFMLCISLERYLLVAHAVWHRSHRSVRLSVSLSLAVWAAALVYVVLEYMLSPDGAHSQVVFSVTSLLPAPFLVFSCVGTWRALRRSLSLQRGERRRVVGALALVVGIYAVLFLPFSLRNLCYALRGDSAPDQASILSSVATSCLLYLSPLADPFLYIFMRRDVRHALDSLCCRAGRRGRDHQLPTMSDTVTSV
ncbi:ovarian cancer G-protein coupled receptor 1-like [Megalops cyprinoides]|uniref:ovarian cancer G-protein coupled receptor 1-like n=1 Tax=Megalops cyprinoides TaxID=118141 RepID=UPI001864F173|nr:ovarian cancer G-protein coupled receptor 1-like [Megalops cyprinoides]